MNYLEFYKERLEKGTLPEVGLCSSIPTQDLQIFRPYEKDLQQIAAEGGCRIFWASGIPSQPFGDLQETRSFTPLRQTIVLLLAAIKGQL